MTFHPEHMKAGIHAAMNSPKTPAHLKPHLAKRLTGAMPMKSKMSGTMPKMNMATAMMPVKGTKPPTAKKIGKRTKVTPVQLKPIMPPAFYGR